VTALSAFKDAVKGSLRASVHNKKIYVWMYAESNVRRRPDILQDKNIGKMISCFDLYALTFHNSRIKSTNMEFTP
jgi:hypothetical protein